MLQCSTVSDTWSIGVTVFAMFPFLSISSQVCLTAAFRGHTPRAQESSKPRPSGRLVELIGAMM